MEGETRSTRGLRRTCPQALPPAPGWCSSDQAGVAASSTICASRLLALQRKTRTGAITRNIGPENPSRRMPCSTPTIDPVTTHKGFGGCKETRAVGGSQHPSCNHCESPGLVHRGFFKTPADPVHLIEMPGGGNPRVRPGGQQVNRPPVPAGNGHAVTTPHRPGTINLKPGNLAPRDPDNPEYAVIGQAYVTDSQVGSHDQHRQAEPRSNDEPAQDDPDDPRSRSGQAIAKPPCNQWCGDRSPPSLRRDKTHAGHQLLPLAIEHPAIRLDKCRPGSAPPGYGVSH